MYLWSGVLYLIQVGDGGAANAEGALACVEHRAARGDIDQSRSPATSDDRRALGGYDPEAGRNDATRPDAADADPGAVAAALAAVRPPRSRLCRGGGAKARRRERQDVVARRGRGRSPARW